MAQNKSRNSYSLLPLGGEAGKPRKACCNCRRRKIKCDGGRPECKNCLTSLGFRDCEYGDDGPTQSQVLQEQIAIVEARIEELQHPQKNPPDTIRLFDPYAAHRPDSTPSSRSGHSTPVVQSLAQRPEGSSSNSRQFGGVSQAEMEPLISNFLRHSSQFGYFLDARTFWEDATDRQSKGATPRPAAVLVDVVNLWAIHLSGSPDLLSHEADYLARALRMTAESLYGIAQSNNVVHRIQAEVLLVHYFMRNGRFLEGKYHLSAAVSLVLSSSLHRIRSRTSTSARTSLPPPRNPMEEFDRVNAFWTVLSLNNCWTSANESPSIISSTDSKIDTPWPLEIGSGLQASSIPVSYPFAHCAYSQAFPNTNSTTVTAFLSGQEDDGTSLAALHAKAAILFEKASLIASNYEPNGEHNSTCAHSFNSIDALIEKFKINLPAVQLRYGREILLIHTLAHNATIKLHKPVVSGDSPSRFRVLNAARSVVVLLSQVPVDKLGHIDAIMGSLLLAAFQAIVAEVWFLRDRRNGPGFHKEPVLFESMATILNFMTVLAPSCRLFESQLLVMQQWYQQLQI
ncbi:fungal-trans domain-containing protein [Favolaschia claudopus]|uniref:Fungal-trans domain-containing protein n=1 Tax=Favolaschia claudopus TaxID=2862362 RepID=A0AAW0D8Z6_9AGAR